MEPYNMRGLVLRIEYSEYYDSEEAFKNPEPFHTFGRWNGYNLFETEGHGDDWLGHVFDRYYTEIIKTYKSLGFSEYLDDYEEPDYTGAPIDREKAESYINAWIDKNLLVLPVYVYEHSGITMNTGGFSCQWDSGQAGYIYMSKEEARKAWSYKKMTAGNCKKVYKAMEDYIKYLAAICEGSVYGFVVETEDGEVLDSCGGFVETEYPIEKTDVYSEGVASLNWHADDILKRHIAKKKAEIKNHVPVLART